MVVDVRIGTLMKGRFRRSKCKNCKELYRKDARNHWHQQYCSKEACREASKVASQARWASKKENKNHFRGPDNAERVREWQKANPGYWKNKKRSRSSTLREILNSEATDNEDDIPTLNVCTLQNILISQPPVIVGLIATLTESTLQEDIANQLECYHDRGADILGMLPKKRMNKKSNDYEKENHHRAEALAADPVPV